MLSEDTVKQLISLPAFLANCNRLAYQLHMSRQDASQELLLELLDHRLKSWSNDDVTLSVKRDLPSLKWRIKYARKDLVRKEAKDANRELIKSQMLAGMTQQASSQAETLEALERLQELFNNKATRTWAKSVLLFDEKETMARFHQTPRQFNNKLAKTCKYCHQHRQPKQPNSHTKERELLKKWADLMVDQDTSDNDIQAFIGEHEEYINEVINSPQVAYQGHLIKDFAHAGKDKYTFNELMHTRYIKLEQELDRRTNHE